MLVSTETRWILNSDQFKIIQDWFAIQNLAFEQENYFPRQDYYLITNSERLGIKLREPKRNEKGEQESKLEIKVLSTDLGPQKFNNGNNGNVNSWLKYSFETIPNEAETGSIIKSFVGNETDRNWLKIEKDRLLIKFDTLENQLVDGKKIIDEGAGIELTKFKLKQNIYYSLGVEAFSMTKKELINFNQTIDFLFHQIKISGLHHLESLSYPQIIKKDSL
ncbi:MAG: hypothetical protein KBC56_03390 [Flavobacterium sp.]|nr:hypothetical protein [Flavobacterium sp.]